MKILKWLDDNLEQSLMVIMLFFMSVIMIIQVIARYVFGNSLTWSEELTRYLFIWSGFLSVSFCIKKKISIRIDQVVNALPGKLSSIFKLIEKVIMLTFFSYMSFYAFDYLTQSIASGQVSPAVGIPMFLIQISPFIGFVLAIIRLIQSLLAEVKLLVKSN